MTIYLAKIVKQEYASDSEAITKVTAYIERFLSSAVHEQGDREAHRDMVEIWAENRVDGCLSLVGSIEAEPTQFYQQEEFDEEIEVIPVKHDAVSVSQIAEPMRTR